MKTAGSKVQLWVAVLGVSCLLLQSASASLFFQDGFNYPSGGGLSGQGPWLGGGSSTLVIGPANLTYDSLTDLGGNDLQLISTGSSTDYTPFNGTSVSAGTVYYSFILEATALPTTNEELTDLLPSGATGLQGSTAALALYVGQQTAGSTYKLGIRHGLSGATYTSGSWANVGSANFIVLGYTFNTGANNDTVSLWVNPTPGGTMPAADVSFVNSALADAANLQNIGFKSQSATAQGNWLIDDVRVGDAWSDVTPITVVPEPSTLALMGIGLGLMAAVIRRRS